MIYNPKVIYLQCKQCVDVLMNELEDIYKRIEYLRNNGVKMKEIADWIHMAPSDAVRTLLQCAAHLSEPAKDQAPGRGSGRGTGTGKQCVEETAARQSGRNERTALRSGTNQEANITGNAFLKLLEKEMQESVGEVLQLQWHVPELQPFFIDGQPQGRTLSDLCIRKQ